MPTPISSNLESTPVNGNLGVAAALVAGKMIQGDVSIVDGTISAVGLPGEGYGLALPGLIDLQVNGYAGIDFAAAGSEDYRHAERALLADGVLRYLPTLITAPEDDLLDALKRAHAAIREWTPGTAQPLGIHLEGVFISPRRPGVHPPHAIRLPDLDLARRLCDAGPIAMWTLAPELPGALPLIKYLRSRGVTVSLGHTDANYAEALAGFDAGATSATHLFNAMRPLGHRDPGILSAALLHRSARLGVIADGVHLSPEVVELIRRIAGRRVYLVSDAVAAAAAPDGMYHIGDVVVQRIGRRVIGPDGQLGGGATPLIDAIRSLVEAGTSLAWAVAASSVVPARAVRRRDLGCLAVGTPADMIVVDDDLRVRRVLSGGQRVSHI